MYKSPDPLKTASQRFHYGWSVGGLFGLSSQRSIEMKAFKSPVEFKIGTFFWSDTYKVKLIGMKSIWTTAVEYPDLCQLQQ